MTTRNLLLPVQLLKVSVSELILPDWKWYMRLEEARRGEEGKGNEEMRCVSERKTRSEKTNSDEHSVG
jgi:hypothetical protein